VEGIGVVDTQPGKHMQIEQDAYPRQTACRAFSMAVVLCMDKQCRTCQSENTPTDTPARARRISAAYVLEPDDGDRARYRRPAGGPRQRGSCEQPMAKLGGGYAAMFASSLAGISERDSERDLSRMLLM
jgi:hypothetical protein